MKLSELKHNHSLTDLLKILLFAILMLAPIGMVATRCLYVIANKNAYQSYYGETINDKEEININSTSELKNNITYYFSQTNATRETASSESNSYFICEEVKYNGQTYNNMRVGFFNPANNIVSIYVRPIADLSIVEFYVNMSIPQVLTLSFTYNGISNTFDNTLYSYLGIYYYEYNNYSYLDNVFEYSVSQLEESNLFNWTKNTAIFSGIQTMTTQLGITNQTIPILLVYWFLLTVIYVIIDIILKLFTYMTHAIGSRKA